MHPKPTNNLFTFFLATGIIVTIIGAPINAQVFSQLSISNQISLPIQLKSNYKETWDTPLSYTFSLSTPYYLNGEIEASVQFLNYNSSINEVTNFSSLVLVVNNRYSLPLTKIIHTSISIGTGIQRLTAEEVVGGLKTETELLINGALRATIDLGNMTFFVESKLMRIYNFRRQDLLFHGIGLQYHIKLPKQIREFIQ